jgi:hypothetical protein
MGSMTAVSTPQDQVDTLMHEVLEEANIEPQQDLGNKEVQSSASGKLLCVFVERNSSEECPYMHCIDSNMIVVYATMYTPAWRLNTQRTALKDSLGKPRQYHVHKRAEGKQGKKE